MLSPYTFFQCFHALFAIIGCCLNIFLIFLAVFHSPKKIRNYATLIVNFALTDFLECFLDYFTQLRVIPTPMKMTLTYVMNGPCGYFGDMICYVGVSMFLHCMPHSVWSLLLSFAYRYYMLFSKIKSQLKIIALLILIYIPSLIQGLTYWENFVTREKIVSINKINIPNYDWDHERGVVTGVVDIRSKSALYAVAHLALPITPVYIAIITIRSRMLSYLSKNTASMSRETKCMHKQLLKVLTIQAILPAFMWIGVTCYFIEQFGIYNHPMMEYAIVSCIILLPTLSPITYLVFVRPYRNKCKRIFNRLRRNHIAPNNSKKTTGLWFSNNHISTRI